MVRMGEQARRDTPNGRMVTLSATPVSLRAVTVRKGRERSLQNDGGT